MTLLLFDPSTLDEHPFFLDSETVFPFQSTFSAGDLLSKEAHQKFLRIISPNTQRLPIGVLAQAIKGPKDERTNDIDEVLKILRNIQESVQDKILTSDEMYSFKLGDLFELIYGIPEQMSRIKDSKLDVKFLKATDLKAIEMEGDTRPDRVEQDHNKEQQDHNKMDYSLIDEKYRLRAEDMVINTKGMPRLYRVSYMLPSWIDYVVTHQYIVLRLRRSFTSTLNEIDPDLILSATRCVLHAHLTYYYQNSKIEFEKLASTTSNQNMKSNKGSSNSGSLTALIPAIKLKDLNSFEIRFPKQKEGQDKLHTALKTYEQLEQLYAQLIDMEKSLGYYLREQFPNEQIYQSVFKKK